ncbi:MAG TPA: hypothetical protein VKZ81_03860 [Pseudonocardia sp.]|uniref:hypothetical protein n=1 Tax=Pseudonocardia sp. TaxID=60912 RepID=UPI002B4B450D|nr:hypothetical protein [Pseudonocardia sp.]HLU54574.1 hypothetical protein [Pseudonocardia sp.]
MNADPFGDAARWSARLAEVLLDVGRRAAELGDSLARDWPDDRGREWADRAARLGSRLGREADAAAELGGAYAREAAAGSPAGGRTGIRLGGTQAQRVGEERGMRIAEIDPPRLG